MDEKKSLTSAQIQYLRIGPKVCTSTTASKELQQTIEQHHMEGDTTSSLSNISKFTYGHFEHTVNNFGVLLHRNFVGTSTLQQVQKFGNIASKIDKCMQQQKDKPAQKKASHRKSISDNRIALKGIYDFKGHKLLLTLKSFSIESVQSHKILQTLQMPFLKLMVIHVSSGKLIKSIENAMRQEGAQITIDYEKMQSKIGHSTNNQVKYQEVPYLFEKSSHQLSINLPCVQLLHTESEYKQNVCIENKDILDIMESDFDNVEQIFKKYFNLDDLQQHLVKTGIDKHSKPAPQED